MQVLHGYILLALQAIWQIATAASPVASSGCKTISPSPAGSVCNTRGKVVPLNYTTGYHPVQPAHADSAGQCTDFCYNRGCKSFSFDSAKSLCYLNTYNSSATTFKPNLTSTSTFWDAACFSCPQKTCPGSSTANVLVNGGFELSPTYFGPWSDFDFYTEYDNAYNTSVRKGHGSQYLSSYQTFGTLDQPYRVCPNQMYLISFDYRTNISSGFTPTETSLMVSTYILAEEYPPSEDTRGASYQVILDPAQNGKWQSVTFSHTSRLDVFNGIIFASDSVISFDLDNVQVVPRLSPLSPTGSELVRNGGFESGVISPWVAHSYGEPTVHSRVGRPGLNGTYLFHASTNVTRPTSVSLQQNVTIVPNTPYLFQATFQVGYAPLFGTWWTLGSYSSDFVNSDTLANNSLHTISTVISLPTSDCQIEFYFSEVWDVKFDGVSLRPLAS